MSDTLDRMSTLDAEFFFAEHGDVPLHIGSVAVFDGPAPTREDLMRLFEAKLPLVPRYRQVVRTAPFQLLRPVWTDDQEFSIKHHVRYTTVAAPGGPEQLRAVAARLFALPLNRRRPLWEEWLLDGLEGGQWAILSKIHHCMVDGVGGNDLMALIFGTDPGERPRRSSPGSRRRGPRSPDKRPTTSATPSPGRSGGWPVRLACCAGPRSKTSSSTATASARSPVTWPNRPRTSSTARSARAAAGPGHGGAGRAEADRRRPRRDRQRRRARRGHPGLPRPAGRTSPAHRPDGGAQPGPGVGPRPGRGGRRHQPGVRGPGQPAGQRAGSAATAQPDPAGNGWPQADSPGRQRRRPHRAAGPGPGGRARVARVRHQGRVPHSATAGPDRNHQRPRPALPALRPGRRLPRSTRTSRSATRSASRSRSCLTSTPSVSASPPTTTPQPT